jgi:peptide/nickel transport system ATP-binding protein
MSDRVGIIYAGKLVELADVVDIFRRPLHPYSYALLRAVPSVGGDKRQLQSLPGEPPDLLHPPDGCRFHPRCTYATDICHCQAPQLEEHNEGHSVACWHPVKTS